LAGWFFEAIVHHKFATGWEDQPRPQPILMESDNRNHPAFSIDLSSPSPTPGTSLSSFTPLRADARTVVSVNLAGGLGDVTLDTDKYYIPNVTNNALFDSFVIDHDRDRRTVVISIFQITISPRHGGSADGYHLIRKIMIRVGALLKEAGLDATIKVAYFLVHPDSKPKHKWEMPAGWSKNNILNNHCGEAFCIPVPVPAFPQT